MCPGICNSLPKLGIARSPPSTLGTGPFAHVRCLLAATLALHLGGDVIILNDGAREDALLHHLLTGNNTEGKDSNAKEEDVLLAGLKEVHRSGLKVCGHFAREKINKIVLMLDSCVRGDIPFRWAGEIFASRVKQMIVFLGYVVVMISLYDFASTSKLLNAMKEAMKVQK